MSAAIVVPGYGGNPRQPIVVAMRSALAQRDIPSAAVAFSTGGRSPSKDFARELAELRAARDDLLAKHPGPVALIGRSFGGRVCAFLAALEPPAALVILGHPIGPAGRPRPRDEAALASVRCPALVVQGDRDALGPLASLQRVAAENPRIEIAVIPDTGHEFRARTKQAVDLAAEWLATLLAA